MPVLGTVTAMTVEPRVPPPDVEETPLPLREARRVVAEAPALPGARPIWVSATGSVLEVRTHVSRDHAVLGPGLRQARIRAGAAVLDLRLVMAVRGRGPIVALLPDEARPGLLAVLYRGAPAPPTPQDRALHAALRAGPARRSPPAAGPVRLVLRRAAETEGCWLFPVAEGPVLPRLARALTAEDAARLTTPGATAFVVGGYRDRAEAQVRAGQAMQRVLLTARGLGLTGAALATDVPVSARELGPFRGLRPQVLLVVDPAGARRPISAPAGDESTTAPA